MKNFYCSPNVPTNMPIDTTCISIMNRNAINHIPTVAPYLYKDIHKKNVRITPLIWDFLLIALSVESVDKRFLRSETYDGWTRDINISIGVNNPTTWNSVKSKLEVILKFLSGDYWNITFVQANYMPTVVADNEVVNYDTDCVCTLSGGVDSLIGAIDLVSINRRPLLISRSIDKGAQYVFATNLRNTKHHFQFGYRNSGKENSTRTRSIVFIAFALIGSCAVNNQVPVEIFLPENGFISINPPLNIGRISSLSTKTTHPNYINGLQNIFSQLDLNVSLKLPYKFKTKGEMIRECRDMAKLIRLLPKAISCGKHKRNARKHCGVCIPCTIRRAAYHYANITDNTLGGYIYNNPESRFNIKNNRPNDIAAIIHFCKRCRTDGLNSIIGASLSFADVTERNLYKNMFYREIDQIINYLSSFGIQI